MFLYTNTRTLAILITQQKGEDNARNVKVCHALRRRKVQDSLLQPCALLI